MRFCLFISKSIRSKNQWMLMIVCTDQKWTIPKMCLSLVSTSVVATWSTVLQLIRLLLLELCYFLFCYYHWISCLIQNDSDHAVIKANHNLITFVLEHFGIYFYMLFFTESLDNRGFKPRLTPLSFSKFMCVVRFEICH